MNSLANAIKEEPLPNYSWPNRGMPPELLDHLSLFLDPITAISFSLCCKDYKGIYERNELTILHTWKPVLVGQLPSGAFPTNIVLRFPDKSKVTLRSVLNSWMGKLGYTWAPARADFIENSEIPDYYREVVNWKEDRKREFREEKWERQDERKERNGEKRVLQQARLDLWRGQLSDAYEMTIEEIEELSDAECDWTNPCSSLEPSESGRDSEPESIKVQDGEEALSEEILERMRQENVVRYARARELRQMGDADEDSSSSASGSEFNSDSEEESEEEPEEESEEESDWE